MKNNQKGFSLIELSIVLIIIGLIVAGITGGTSLINSARARATMSEVTSYRIAVNTYYTAKDRYPGDAATGTSADDQILGTEMLTTWTSLADIDAIEGTYATPSTGDEFVVNDGLGDTKTDGAGWMMGYYDGTDPDFNAIGLTNLTATNTVTDNTSGIVAGASGNVENSTTGSTAETYDIKMDDGTMTSGQVRGISSTATACSYSSTSTSATCVPLFNIDA